MKEAPFFIVGAQRSGTTLFRLILNAHSKIAIPEEGTFWMPLIGSMNKDYDALIKGRVLKNYIKYIRKNEAFKVWQLNIENIITKIDFDSGVTLRALMELFYTENAIINNKSIWGDKTPSFFRKVNDLSVIFPNARFIHLVRDGRDIYFSLRGRERGRRNVAVAALEWKYKIQKVRRFFGQLPVGRCLEVRYEDILNSPESKVLEVCNFLNVDYEESMLDFYKSSHKYVGKHHSGLIFKAISRSPVKRWKKLMNDSDNKIYESVARNCLEDQEYEIINKINLNYFNELKVVALLCFGLPLRCFQVFFTAFKLRFSSIFGLRTFASGGRGHNIPKNKVLIVSPLGYTGLAYYDFSLSQSLSENGVDVDLCTSDKWILNSYSNTFSLSKLYKCCSGDINKASKGWNYILSSFRILVHAIKNKIRIVHFQIVELPLVDMLLMILLKIFGKRIVFTPHDIVHNKKYPLSNTITSILYTISNRIIIHNNANLEPIIKRFKLKPEKINVIPHGGYEYFVNGKVTMSHARRRFGLSENHRILLFFGNIKPNKGLHILINSLPLIAENVDNVRLIIAGRLCGGITEEWLFGLIKEKGISDIVIPKLEFIPEEMTTFYYMASDIVVLPYTEISESGVLRFAQTCGRPVMCSDLKEFKETVVQGETGYLFKQDDHVDLARQVTKVFSSGQLEQIGDNARRQAKEHYNWKKIARLTMDVYDDVSS